MESGGDFVKAVAFCLAYDQHAGDREAALAGMDALRPLAEWALTPGENSPAPGDSSRKIALVSGGATRIKAYVFESARLPEIRGASGLLDRINIEDTPWLWHEFGCEDCIIYANGGEVLAFAPVNKAAPLADEIERLYSRETLVAQSVAVHAVLTLKQLREGWLADQNADENALTALLGYNPVANKTFGALVSALVLAKLRRREGNPTPGRDPEFRGIAQFETVPIARRCSSCERRLAVFNDKVAEDDRPLCEPCGRKRVFGLRAKNEDAQLTRWSNEGFGWSLNRSRPFPSWISQFERVLTESPDLRKQYSRSSEGGRLPDFDYVGAARDLGEIAQASKGFVGLVYADGNNMGQLIEERKTPRDYWSFARDVYRANLNAVFEALAENLGAVEISRKGSQALIHPFEILSIGGDDVFLIVPAYTALEIACAISEKVEAKLRQYKLAANEPGAGGYEWELVQRCEGLSPADQCKVSMSVGVVLADSHTPVFYLEELASQLLKSAKQRAKQLKRNYHYYGGTIDFLSLKSTTMIAGTVDDFRGHHLTKPDRRLYARPYTILEMRALIDSIRLLKASRFPRNQLHRLRESLWTSKQQSIIDYLYFLSRDPKTIEARTAIEGKWLPSSELTSQPWRAQLDNKDQAETIWHDVVDLYDFVMEKEQPHVEDQH